MSLRITLSAFASILFVAAATAGEAELRTIAAECPAQLNMNATQCACIAEKAGQQLNDNQQKFMVANITKDQATFTAMQSSMPADQMIATGQFMAAVPDQCK